MKVFGPADQPYLTTDSILAFALYLSSVQFCDESWPCVNSYTEEQLKDLYSGSGLLPQQAAIQAVKDGHKGTVNYMFHSPEPQLIKAFIDQKQMLEKAEGVASDVIKNLMTDFETGARTLQETLVRLVCTIVYMRGEFLKIWSQLEPLIQINEPIEQSEEILPDGSKVIIRNGFKYIGAYATEKTKQKMGLC